MKINKLINFGSIKKIFSILTRKFISPKIPKNNGGKIFLNLGCGAQSSKEFINIDVSSLSNIHYIQDIKNLFNFQDNSVDMVYASHVVEHIPKGELEKVILEWRRVLKPNGVFRFAVPDFDALCDVYIKNSRDILYVRDQILGQEPPYNNHYTLWNYNFAENLLKKLGFKDIKIWYPEKVSYHDFIDRSSRRMNTPEGQILISLNIEAKKI